MCPSTLLRTLRLSIGAGLKRPTDSSFVRPALARECMNIILVRKDYSVRSSKPNPCMPGLGQGHDKKRHLHAHSPVNFKELKCYGDFNRIVVDIFLLDKMNERFKRMDN